MIPLPRLALILPLCLLSACMEATPTANQGPAAAPRADDGVASRLKLGSTQADVEAALGFDAGFERNPANFDESCVSYPYGDGTLFVHAVFRAGSLVETSDGHGALCTYGTLVSTTG